MSMQNTTIKVKTILLSVCLLSSAGLFAQSEKTSEKSSIVMTKSELNSFLTTVAESRRAQLRKRENRNVKQDLAELRLQYERDSRSQGYGNNGVSNQQVLQELRYLNQRIDNLGYRNDNSGYNNPSRSRDNSTIIMPGGSNATNPMYMNDRGSSTTVIPSNKKKIDELQSKIDSLKSSEANRNNFVQNNSYPDSLSNLKGSLSDIRRQLENMEAKLKAPKNVKPEKEKSYFKQQVYFANNSETVNSEYLRYVQDLTQILITYPEAKVLLEGWASPVGKADYNKRLSMRRSEAVQKAFVNNGIDQSRILTSFKGEDKKSSDQHARRVDMSIIVQ